MKTLLMLLVASFLQPVLASRTQAADDPVRHVVVFKYKESATQEQIDRITNGFKALPEKIDGILAFEYGENNSPEGLNRGFTHVYFMTFESVEARDAYLPHPEHKKFVDMLQQLDVLEEAFVVDYIPRE